MSGPADPAGVLDRLWRADHAGMLGVPARRLSDLQRAEDALQEAAGEALRRWPDDGVPGNPAGWLVTAAWRNAVDRLRRDAADRPELALLAARQEPGEPAGEDQPGLTFGCCHPACNGVVVDLNERLTARS